VRKRAAIPACRRHDTDSARPLDPLLGRYGEACRTYLCSNYVKFDVIKISVVQLLPSAQEVNISFVAEVVPYHLPWFAAVEFGDVRHADEILTVLVRQPYLEIQSLDFALCHVLLALSGFCSSRKGWAKLSKNGAWRVLSCF
jgi:hypothetical protein